MRGQPNFVMGSVLAVVAGSMAAVFGGLGVRANLLGLDFFLLLLALSIGGVAMAAYGAFQFARSRKPGGADPQADAQLIFRSMLALAAVDGALDPAELAMIQRCCSRYFGRDMSEAAVRQAFDHFMTVNYAGFAFDGAERKASPPARAMAIRAAALVGLADGEPTPAERQRLAALAALLDLSEADLAAATTEADALFAAGDV